MHSIVRTVIASCMVVAVSACAQATPTPQAAAVERNQSNQSAVITTTSTEQMEQLLKSQGYAYTIDEDGDLVWMHDGYKSIVLISREKNNLMFKAVFTDGGGNLETVNQWNQNVRYSRSYMSDDGDTVLELDLDLDGGVTEQHVIEWLKVCRDSFRMWIADVVLAEQV
ncbi:YbjN domain-containing protein [Pseudidiomarina mangrovi]|uniref:YbjN domain-containing protein n=1 Tax=Pseudidiomarina mangrovi TaxID=2487133 RepID=UPI000FCA511A|nr:YbjN domain-containing protein [Pseudidiomarina mangrovi]CAI8161242.1 MAG: Uncharacterised protein [Pseudidiomarina mangrovi]